MVGWHLQPNGHESGQIPGDSEGQGSLAGCCPWDCRVRHYLATEQQQHCGCSENGSLLVPGGQKLEAIGGCPTHSCPGPPPVHKESELQEIIRCSPSVQKRGNRGQGENLSKVRSQCVQRACISHTSAASSG